jgi:hypothetical protein
LPIQEGPLIEHWTGGSSWTSVPVPAPAAGGVAEVNAISAVSATDIWAVGESFVPFSHGPFSSFIIHWDGTNWTQVPSPSPDKDDLGLVSVSAVSADDVWAVGGYDPVGSPDGTGAILLLHWDGTSWTQKLTRSPDDSSGLDSVSATSATDAWAVGTDARGSAPLIEHWNGTNWMPQMTGVPVPPAGRSLQLTSVSARSANDVWAVGDSQSNNSIDESTVILHWDGSTWAQVLSPSPGADSGIDDLTGVQAISATNAWAIGQFGAGFDPLVLHWDGSYWTQALAPAGFDQVSAVSASAAGDLWVAGITGSPSPSTTDAAPLAQAQIAVNANAALGLSGFVTKSVAAANLAPGTNPAVAVQPDGSWKVAWQASSGLVWTLDSAGHQVNTQQKAAAGTSPAITALASGGGGGFEVVFSNASGNALWAVDRSGTVGALGSGPAVAGGTSPAIASDGVGGSEVAYHAAGTDDVQTVDDLGAGHDTGAKIAAGASPAITALSLARFEIVYPNASGTLSGIGQDGVARVLGSGPAVAAGASPAVASAPGGGFEAVYPATGTGELWTVDGTGASWDAGVPAAAGTSPAIAAVVSGGYEIAYQATAGRELTTLAGGQVRDTGFAMGVHDSPVMAPLPPTPSRATVPKVLGLVDASARIAIERAGLRVGSIVPDNTCLADAGIVTGEDPEFGTKAMLGDTVELAESTGNTAQGLPCHPVVPSLFGDSDQAARTALRAVGLVVGQVTTGSSCQVGKGDVFTQSIGANTVVAPGTVINFAESNGKDQHGNPCNVE